MSNGAYIYRHFLEDKTGGGKKKSSRTLQSIYHYLTDNIFFKLSIGTMRFQTIKKLTMSFSFQLQKHTRKKKIKIFAKKYMYIYIVWEYKSTGYTYTPKSIREVFFFSRLSLQIY